MDQTDYYNEHASVYYEDTVDLDMTEILEQFVEQLPESAAVLDLGCGSGRDSLFFIEKGFDVTSIDGAKELCELAEIHIGQDVICMQFEDLEFNEVFDGVWACASLVHFPKSELGEILNRIVRSLKPEGILYMSFKYGEFAGERNGLYYSEYRTKELKELIGHHKELELLDIFKTDDVRTDRAGQQWINVFAKKEKHHSQIGEI